ncbi:Predicted arabinose efflux permease, MFS family [Pedococcus cremeus]|uniref:Predicted arabinose efflux permease, MFS family n=1 Tax=Pedococcus cremeus TaxID=587636 RepID=A0A1H9WZI2_9MICO|nr:MFS transporter [Pedococcus cremeus]SES39358.1 Predicted arabinose efflux permease, MFS family [Pedococcus cremeus]
MTRAPAPVAADLPLHCNRDFSLLWLGEGVSVLGNATTSVLLPLLAVVGFDAGPEWMGLITAAAWAPWLLIGLPAGAWVDRLPARRVMVASDLLAAASLASVPVAWALDVLTLPHLVAAAFANGVCTVFFRAAYPLLVRQVAPRHQQETAFARLFGTESAMQVAGPGAGGVLAQALSAAWGLAADALSFLVSATCLLLLRLDGPGREVRSQTGEDPVLLRIRIREGIDYLRQDRLLRFFTIVGGVSNFGLTGYGALLVLFLVRDVRLDEARVGIVMAVGAAGGVVGASLATRLSQRLGSARALLSLQLLAGPPALLVPLGGPGAGLVAMVAGMVLVGIGVVAGNVVRGAWRNRYVPVEMVARQVTTAQVVNLGTMPVAALAAGWLGSAIGLRQTIALMAAVHTAACLSMWRSPLRGLRDMPERAEDLARATT